MAYSKMAPSRPVVRVAVPRGIAWMKISTSSRLTAPTGRWPRFGMMYRLMRLSSVTTVLAFFPSFPPLASAR
jgi:hypothetical protein